MTTANGTKTNHKRPLTIYNCSPEQKIECDYKYLARVWFFRTVSVIVVSGAGYLIYGSWKTAAYTTATEYRINDIDSRLIKVEAMQSNVDTIKEWLRPKK